MPTDVTFTGLDQDSINDMAEFLGTLLKEAAPNLNVSRGSMIWELILEKAAISHVYTSNDVESLRNYWNLQAVIDDPANAENSIVDMLLSNFNITRSEGTKAVGQVEIILTGRNSLTVTAGTLFSIGDISYTNLSDQVAVVSEGDKLSDDDRILTDRGDGTYSFKVDVVAVDAGIDGNISIGTTFEINPPPTYLSTAKAVADSQVGRTLILMNRWWQR